MTNRAKVYCRLLMLASAQTCFICSDRVTGETKPFSHNLNDVKAMTAYVTMTRTELISAPEYCIQCVFSKMFCYLASLFYSV